MGVGILSITFLDQIEGKNVFSCPPRQQWRLDVDAEQVFIVDLEAKEADTNRLTFPRIQEVQAIVKRLKISQVTTSAAHFAFH